MTTTSPIARAGRFAPSPTGPLHAGSLAAAMASWLDVRAHGGSWLLRIEDLDGPRVRPSAEDAILATLTAFGFRWAAPPIRQSLRDFAYRQAFERLRVGDAVYPCGCTRREIETAVDAAHAHAAGIAPAIYPGTCRAGLPADRSARAWRMRAPDHDVTFCDRAVGPVRQNVAGDVGDFVVLRADGRWAYQLAVVVDDAAHGITDVVRGIDLLDSTPRQRVLQRALGLPMPRTLHIDLVKDAAGRKLSKSHQASALNDHEPLPALHAAARHLGLAMEPAADIARFWERATVAWATRHPPGS